MRVGKLDTDTCDTWVGKLDTDTCDTRVGKLDTDTCENLEMENEKPA